MQNAARIEAKDTYREVKKTAKKTAKQTKTVYGFNAK